jgi:putative Mn2+ efflux pump MntP
MIGILSVTSVVIGTALAWMAARRPAHRKVMEIFGGILLIAGFALLGYSLDCIVGRP